MKSILKWSAVMGMLISVHAYAFGPENQLIQKFQNIHTMDANFQQTVYVNGRRTQTTSGHFAMQRPGHLRWAIERPHKQLYVANGQTIWIYEPELKQVTQKPQSKGLGGTAGLFLSNQPSLWVQRYKVLMSKGGARTSFELHAKTSKTPFSKVILSFNGDKLSEIQFWDQLGQNSQIRLSGVKVNQGVSASQFRFSPPKNTDVIKM